MSEAGQKPSIYIALYKVGNPGYAVLISMSWFWYTKNRCIFNMNIKLRIKSTFNHYLQWHSAKPTFSVGSNIDTGIAAHRVDTDLVLLADVDLSDRTLVCVDTASPVISQVIACLSTRAPVTTQGVSTAVSTTSIILTTFILICHIFIDALSSLLTSKVLINEWWAPLLRRTTPDYLWKD